jgi:hypothetical protein
VALDDILEDRIGLLEALLVRDDDKMEAGPLGGSVPPPHDNVGLK